MKRTGPPLRRTPLAPGKPPKRRAKLEPGAKPLKRGPMKRVNKARQHRRFEAAFGSVERVLWIKSLGCVVPGCIATDVQACHATSRGAGGTADDLFACCAEHHRLQHQIGTAAFQRRFGLDLQNVAHATALRWRAFTRTAE